MSMSGIDLRPGLRKRSKKQVVLDRVDVGDAERVGDDRAGGRASPGADRDAVLLGVLDEVPDDQEVGRETHLPDHAEFELEPLPGLGGNRVAVAPAQALFRHPAEHLLGRRAVVGRVVRQQDLAERDLDLAALGDLEGHRYRLGPFREGGGHLVAVLEVELVRIEGHLRRVQGRLRLDAEQGGVVLVVLAAQVMNVGGRHQRPADLAGDPGDPGVGLVLVVDPVLLNLHVDLLGAEYLDQLVEVGTRVVRPVFDQPLDEAGLEAAGQADDSLRVAVEEIHVDVGLAAVVALEEPFGAERHQVAEAGVVLGQKGQVVALVAGHLPDRVTVIDEVGLDAEDRLYVVLTTGLVHVESAVHHTVVGQAQRRHVELCRTGSHLLDVARSVEHRVLAVNVEVGYLRPA